jgi:hypothetical protein
MVNWNLKIALIMIFAMNALQNVIHHCNSTNISTGYRAISLENLVWYVFAIRLVFSCGIIEPEQYTLFVKCGSM